MDQKMKMHKDLCDRLHTLYSQKNHDYGDSFHQTFLEEGFAMPRIRLSDKLNRFKNLTKNPVVSVDNNGSISSETLEDTLLDLANYALMTILEMESYLYNLKENDHE